MFFFFLFWTYIQAIYTHPLYSLSALYFWSLHFLFFHRSFFWSFLTQTLTHSFQGSLCALRHSLVFGLNGSFNEFLLCVFLFFPLVCCLPLSLTHRHTSLVFSQRCLFRSRRYSLRTNFPVNNHGGSLSKRACCQSHFFNRLQLYTESIKLKYLRSASYSVNRHSLPMNIITVMGCVYAFSTTLKELNWVWICESYFSNASFVGLINC